MLNFGGVGDFHVLVVFFSALGVTEKVPPGRGFTLRKSTDFAWHMADAQERGFEGARCLEGKACLLM